MALKDWKNTVKDLDYTVWVKKGTRNKYRLYVMRNSIGTYDVMHTSLEDVYDDYQEDSGDYVTVAKFLTRPEALKVSKQYMLKN